jgi:quinol monooxygenase YgiN
MIVITGKAAVAPANRDAILKIGLEQVKNSRAEAGCLSYAMYEDVQSPNTFFFYEEWKDQAAVDFHFKQSYCLAFIKRARELALNPPELVIRRIAE